MTVIHYEHEVADAALAGRQIAVVGYGNQGRSWALNLRDSGCDVSVHVRADATRDQAVADGFSPGEIAAAGEADVVALLVPDDIVPTLDVTPRADALVVVGSGYSLAFGRYEPACDAAILAPRMLGPEVRRTYLEGAGFISAVGVHNDVTGTAWPRLLAVAKALGALKQGAIELTPFQEAVLDLATEQLLAPALRHVNVGYTLALAELGIPMEAILCELFFSGEVERTFRRLRLEGYAAQLEHHSPVSQYGQLSRQGAFDHLDVLSTMRRLVEDIASGRFADEWDAEREAGHPRLAELKAAAAGPELQAFEADLRARLGEAIVERPLASS